MNVLADAQVWFHRLSWHLIASPPRRFPVPSMLHFFAVSLLSQYLIASTRAHIAAWHEGINCPFTRNNWRFKFFISGMYCLNGTTPGVDNQNTNSAAVPLYKVNLCCSLEPLR